ncbi:hypothetical protein [Botrimarina sp.]|uniref:hypothetical protein n=1 Tax=Botrimarina sp. TaxID=2795802 RepID=UPI0032EE32C1
MLLTFGVTNTTGSPTFGAGATASMLTGVAIDLPNFVTVQSGTFSPGTKLDTLLNSSSASLPPFGSFELAIADNGNLLGGNANGALAAGASDTASLIVSLNAGSSAINNAMELALAMQTGFNSQPTDLSHLKAAVRFQQVNAGEGSDKLLYNPPEPPTPDPDDNPEVAPEPGSLLVWAAIGGLVTAARRRKG